MDDRILRGIKLGKKRRLEENFEKAMKEVDAEIELIEKRMEKTAEEENFRHIEKLEEIHEGTAVDKDVDRQYESEEVDPAGDDSLE